MAPSSKRSTFAQKLKRALAVSSTMSASTLTLGPPVLALGLAKLLTPPKQHVGLNQAAIDLTNRWLGVNNWLIEHVLPHTEWRIHIDSDLDLRMDGRYVMISNHQSWVDTTVTQYFGLKRMPLTRFFTKYELIFIPFVGQAFKILGFPMMKRHTKAQIAANPSLKARDLDEARRACEQLLSQPYTLLNYLEGTRFTPEKHAAQQSPYQNLLKPKAGGLALALNILQGQIDALLDFTIVYPDGVPGYGEFWLGEVPRIVIDIRKIAIPDWVNSGDYDDDADYRARFQQWVDDIWHEKDARITRLKLQANEQISE